MNASYPYSNYNINSQGSNIQFISQNNSYLYAWLQNINTTTITIWIKNFNSSNTINMQVFPEFDNLLSASGYLGEAPQLSSAYGTYFNANKVFPYASDFNGTSLPSFFKVSSNVTNFTINNGIKYFMGNTNGAGIYIPINGSGYALAVYGSYPSVQIRTGFTSLTGTYISEMSIENWTQNDKMLLFNTNITNANSILYQSGLNPLVSRLYEIQQSNGQVSYSINGTEYYFPHTEYNYPLYPNVLYGSSSGKVNINYFYLRYNITMPTFTIELNIYNVNIKSFDKQSNPIHNYFFYRCSF